MLEEVAPVAGGDSPDTNDIVCEKPNAQEQPLSKNQAKKLEKKQRYEQVKAQRKAQEKEQRKAQVAARHAARQEAVSQLTDEQRAERRAVCQQRLDQRRHEKQEKEERMDKALESGVRVVFDLGFSHLMSEGQMASMKQQLMYCYSANIRSPNPAHMYLTSFKGAMADLVREKVAGFEHWKVTVDERDYADALPQGCMPGVVYLTADSEHELDEVDGAHTYVIGAIVDRNAHKGLCLGKAQEQGITTARLPLRPNIDMPGATPVLTVNHVFDILLKQMQYRDWKQAFDEVIPHRKRGVGSVKDQNEDLAAEEAGEAAAAGAAAAASHAAPPAAATRSLHNVAQCEGPSVAGTSRDQADACRQPAASLGKVEEEEQQQRHSQAALDKQESQQQQCEAEAGAGVGQQQKRPKLDE